MIKKGNRYKFVPIALYFGRFGGHYADCPVLLRSESKNLRMIDTPEILRRYAPQDDICNLMSLRVPRFNQHSFAPAGMASLTISRFSFSSPLSVWTAEISMPQDSRPIIFLGGRLVMATRVLPTSSSGL